jgi:perosamine synthetase
MTAQLALLGGAPLRAEPLPPYNTIGEAEKRAVMEVLDVGELSGFVAGPIEQFWGGRKVRALEQVFREYFGVRHAIAVNSATSGLHAALSATGIGPGDEIITSPYTMAASATCALMCGAVPVFADVEPDTFCLDPDSVEANITPNTKAIVAVNIFGQAADLEPLRAIAERHKLFLIEDNAQAPGAKYRGRLTGTIGDAGVFSFNRHKTMQSGEGGVIITDNDTLALKAALMRNHGEVAVAGMGLSDIVNTVGVNYRMTEMEAAVALEQFRRLDDLNGVRVRLAERLANGLSKLPGIIPPKVRADSTHVYYFFVMRYDEAAIGIPRDLFVRAVQAEGFMLRGGYVRPIYLEPLYQQKICFGSSGFPFTANSRNASLSYAKGLCPVAESLQERDLLLTNIIYPPLTENDMDMFVAACQKVLANREPLLRAFL